jgi:GT2 family glycosyltransferase
MKASVIVLAWNGLQYLPACLDALVAQGYADFEVIVVDNGSTDDSADFVAEHYPQVRLIRNERNLGFAAGNNVGLRAATGDVLVLLNQDTVVQPGWLAALVSAFEDSTVGVAGCKILDLDGETIQHAGGYLLSPIAEGKHYGFGERDEGQYDQPREVEYLTGAALAVRRAVFEQVGGLDERFFPGYYEDTDLCVRIHQAGFKVLYWPAAVVHHHGSGSFRQGLYSQLYLSFRNQIRFIFKHFSTNEILVSFIPAMMDRITNRVHEELHAVALGSLDAMLIWPQVAPAGIDYATKLRVLQAFRELYDQAVQCEQAMMRMYLPKEEVTNECRKPDQRR